MLQKTSYKILFILSILTVFSKIGVAQVDQKLSIDSIKSHIIDTVQISRGIYEFNANKFTFNVAQSTVSRGKDLEAMIRITPGLEINSSGNISLFGIQNALIFINDKQVNLQGKDLGVYIKSIPSESISRIEVIPNPPFSQSINAQPIVKVYLKRRTGDGFDLTVNSSLNIRNRISESVSAFSNIKYGELTLTPIISLNNERTRTNKESEYFEKVIKENLNTKNKDNVYARSFILHSDYNLSKKSNISGVFVLSSQNSKTLMNGKGYDTDIINIDRTFKSSPTYIRTGLAYKQLFKTSNLSIDFNFSNHKNSPADSLKNFENIIYASKGKLRVRNINSSINYTVPLSEKLELSIGSKIESNNNRINSDIYSTDNSLTDNLKYSELIWHNYFNINLPLSKFAELAVGGKLESSNINLLTQTLEKRNYNSFLPNISAIKKIGKGQLMLAYNRQLSRPSYSQLNPTPFVISKNLLSQGNPELTPEFWNTFSVNYIPKRGVIIFARILSNSNLIVYDQNILDDGKGNYIKPINISERQTSYITGFTLKSKISKLNYSITNNFLYADNPSIFNSKNSFLYKVVLNSDIKSIFNSGIDMSFYGTYRNSQININEEKSSYLRYYFDFTKSFKKELTVGLTIENPILIFKNKTQYNYNDGAFRIENYMPDIRSFKIYFSKKFGKTKIKAAKKLESDDERLSTKREN